MLDKVHANVAIFCAQGLGDALIQMVLANNLARQGYRVTFYSDYAHQVCGLVDAYRIKPFPDYAEIMRELSDQHVILYDSSGLFARRLPAQLDIWFQHNAICYRMSDARPRHRSIRAETVAERLPLGLRDHAARLIKFNQALRGNYGVFERPAVVGQLVEFLHAQVGFQRATAATGIVVESTAKDDNKLVIHPTSSNEDKNWPPENYKKLARRLKMMGYAPVFTVSPVERSDWMQILDGEFDVPLFESIAELAEFYRSACYFIGGDSGAAHLASCLGVPTLQIFRGRKKRPAWRAGWSPNRVVVARFPFNLIRKHWKKGVNVDRVLRTFESMTGKTTNSGESPQPQTGSSIPPNRDSNEIKILRS